MYEICFLKLEKEKRPKVFEEWGLLTSPKVAVCLRVQQKKCLVFCLKSVCIHCPYICSIVPHPLSVSFNTGLRCIQIYFYQSFPERWRGEEQQWRGEWGVKEEESSAVFTVWYLGGILLPRPAPASPPLTSGRCFRLRESRSGDGDLSCRRGGGWLCQSPMFSS